MTNLKYAHVERERRWLLDGPPPFPGDAPQVRIVDRYLTGTRLRLREVRSADGEVVRKLGHKVRLGNDAREVACTSLYLDDAEWRALLVLPGTTLSKIRVLVPHAGHTVALDLFDPPHRGLVLAEVDGAPGDFALPERYRVVREVTDEEDFTGAALARPGRSRDFGA